MLAGHYSKGGRYFNTTDKILTLLGFLRHRSYKDISIEREDNVTIIKKTYLLIRKEG